MGLIWREGRDVIAQHSDVGHTSERENEISLA